MVLVCFRRKKKSGGGNLLAEIHRFVAVYQSANHRRRERRCVVKFTRIPKVEALIAAGVPTEVIPTYYALSDYSANKTGLCIPKMQTASCLTWTCAAAGGSRTR
jgi:hypothetical protein